MVDSSKSLGTLLVIIGTTLFFIVCDLFIWRLLLALGALYLVAYGLRLRLGIPFPTPLDIWMGKFWNSSD